MPQILNLDQINENLKKLTNSRDLNTLISHLNQIISDQTILLLVQHNKINLLFNAIDDNASFANVLELSIKEKPSTSNHTKQEKIVHNMLCIMKIIKTSPLKVTINDLDKFSQSNQISPNIFQLLYNYTTYQASCKQPYPAKKTDYNNLLDYFIDRFYHENTLKLYKKRNIYRAQKLILLLFTSGIIILYHQHIEAIYLLLINYINPLQTTIINNFFGACSVLFSIFAAPITTPLVCLNIYLSTLNTTQYYASSALGFITSIASGLWMKQITIKQNRMTKLAASYTLNLLARIAPIYINKITNTITTSEYITAFLSNYKNKTIATLKTLQELTPSKETELYGLDIRQYGIDWQTTNTLARQLPSDNLFNQALVFSKTKPMHLFIEQTQQKNKIQQT